MIKTEDHTLILIAAIVMAGGIELALIFMGEGKEFVTLIFGLIGLLAGIQIPTNIFGVLNGKGKE